MKKLAIISIALLTVSTALYARNTITGTFPGLVGQQVKLVGFEGFDTYTIDSITVSANGAFQLSYYENDYGMAYLAAEDNKSFIVILADEDIKMEGELLAMPGSVLITDSKQNQLFGQFAAEHQRRKQTLSAWIYLEKVYRADPLFAVHKTTLKRIKQEKQRIEKEDKAFLEGLDPQWYVSWFLPLRKLVASAPTIVQQRVEEIPVAISAFRAMDYTDPRLYKSGLLKETIESHFLLIENSGRMLDSVYVEMKISIDHMVENLLADEQKLNEISGYLFNFLEKRSLFPASEYLALKLLNEQSCTLNNNLAEQLESYRAMKKGNTAPDIVFKGDLLAPEYENNAVPQKISDIESKYTALVFGASWCPQCGPDITEILGHYYKWNKLGVEVVFISLDTDKDSFVKFAGPLPFISVCDYKQWESPVVKDYHVFATPTLYLLDDEQKILLRPNSVKHLDAWIDWYLVKGNS